MLNQSQQAAACHGSGPCLVVAGPGSGKTTVLTERICYLVQELHIPEESICVVTFTREAASEMRRRYLWKAKSNGSRITFGTFHHIFFQILKEDAKYEASDILTGQKKHRMLENCRKQLGYEELLSELSEDDMAKVQEAFAKKKDQLHVLDFDDMIGKTKSLLLENQQVLEKWRNRFTYFLVDEMQDMSDEQYEVLQLLAYPKNNLYMVGDDDQAIYGFRGANPSIMLGFPEDYPGAKQIVLHVNYRCRPKILEHAMALISNNKQRFSKDIKAAARKEGEVSYVTYKDAMEEAQAVAKRIAGMLEEHEAETIGVLFRNRMQAMLLSEELKAREVGFYFKDSGNQLLGHWITRDIASYLRMSLDTVRREDMLHIYNKPDRGLTRYSFNQTYIDLAGLALEYREEPQVRDGLLLLEKQLFILKELRPFAAMNFIRKGIGYEGYLVEYAKKSGAPVEEYLHVLEELSELSKEFADGNAFLTFLNSELPQDSDVELDRRISLHTYHGAKGLEFDRVILLDVNEGVTPSKRAESMEAMEEERRMFYVALTRAKKELVLCTVKQRANELLYPSRFLQECGIYASSSSSNIALNTSDTVANSSSDAMLSKTGVPSSSSS